MRTRILSCGVVLCLLGLTGSTWAGPEVKLIPGTPIEFEVPSAPASLAQRVRKSVGEAVRMTIELPADYSPSRSYPVLVFLNGGDGGMGGELNMGRPFLGGQGYVLCNIPLFKKDVQGETPDQQLYINPRDRDVAIPALKLMLNELWRRVPNLDPKRSVLAGFSNGANTTALVLWSGDADLLSRFSSFVLVEGGFWLGLDYDQWTGARFPRSSLSGLAGKRVLLMVGAQQTPADRPPFIKEAQQTQEALKKAGVDSTLDLMPDTGHDFPASAMTRARQWLSR